jgi:hypothetical protein
VLVLFFLNKEKYSRNLNRNLENNSRGLIFKQTIHTKKVRKENTFFNVKRKIWIWNQRQSEEIKNSIFRGHRIIF